ncbi:hypothetical protein [Pseudomonas fluorescens]|nr:hypothetical protein [Pseudomonas fluorescens]
MPEQLIEDLASLRSANVAINKLDIPIRHKIFGSEAAHMQLARQSVRAKA